MPQTSSKDRARPRVVIIGGGFGGLTAARALKHAPVRVTLIDENNHQAFQPLLYQVATAGLEAADVGYPLRTALHRQRNAEVLMVEATGIDPEKQTVELATGRTLSYDFLVVATGSKTSYFGREEWPAHAPGLKSIRNALTIRYTVLSAFEEAEQARSEEDRRALLTFVVVGGGPTGVELAGAIAELTRHTLKRDFDHIDTTTARVLLLEGGDALLPSYSEKLQKKARAQLTSLGVHVRTGAMVSDIDAEGVTIGNERIEARTVLWAAGVTGTDLAQSLGVPLDRDGRVKVTPTLNAPGHSNIFVLGDLVALSQDGKPLPGLAAMAMQTGRYAARAIRRQLWKMPPMPFRYRNKGKLSTIGRSRAVGEFPGGIEVSGTLAWLAYLSIHLFYLAGGRHRASVFLSWTWSYLTYGRGARLISSTSPEATDTRPLHRNAAAPRD